MLPLLTRSEEGGSAGPPSSTVPPPRFRPLSSKVREVYLSPTPYRVAEGETSSQRAGLRYERQTNELLLKKFPHYMPGPYIHFVDGDTARTCQPDGIAIFNDLAFIFEIKYQHMPEAWWQLEKLYRPLLEKLWPTKTISCVEVVRSYDPSMPFPCSVKLIESIEEWCFEPRKDFGVWIWRK